MICSVRQAAPHLRIARFRREIDAADHAVLEGSADIRGPAFEAAFATHEGRAYAVGVGTDAIATASRALGSAVTCADRDAIAASLSERGIDTAVHYAPPLNRHPAFRAANPCPVPCAEALAGSLLSLPIQPEVAAGLVAACRSTRGPDLDGAAIGGRRP